LNRDGEYAFQRDLMVISGIRYNWSKVIPESANMARSSCSVLMLLTDAIGVALAKHIIADLDISTWAVAVALAGAENGGKWVGELVEVEVDRKS
jgi:hypothetical protein